MKLYKYFVVAAFVVAFTHGCASTKKDWKSAVQQNTVFAYEKFISKHPDSPLASDARSGIEKINYEKAVSIGTIEAYEDFVRRFPDSGYSGDVRLRIEELCYRRTLSYNSVTDYELFIKRFPDSRFAGNVRSRLEKLYYDTALSYNELYYFDEYLEKYPDGKYADDVRSRIDALLPCKSHPAFKDVRNVKVVIEQSYGGIKGDKLPILDFVKEFLKYAGVSVVQDGSRDYDATFRIAVEGTALGASYIKNYSGGSTYFCVTGARLHGKLTFETKGGYILEENVSAENVPQTLSGCPTSANKSAYEYAFEREESFSSKIAAFLQKAFGINILMSALEDKNWKVADPAKKALKSSVPNWQRIESAKKCVFPFLASAMKNESYFVRIAVVEALGTLKDPRATELLISALEDEDFRIREKAVESLKGQEDPGATEALSTALVDKACGIRYRAAEALEGSMDSRAVSPLISALSDGSCSFRDKAAELLGDLGDVRAVEPLISALSDKNIYFVRTVTGALKRITGQDFGEDPIKWQQWWEQNKVNILLSK